MYTNAIEFKIRLVVRVKFRLSADVTVYIGPIVACKKFVMKFLQCFFKLVQLVTNAQLEESPLFVPLHPFEGHVFILNFHCISALLQTRKGFQIKSNVPQIVTETNQQFFFS